MYDFNFGTKKEIERQPEHFLIFVKRLLPRWANGIPDSECVAIFRTLRELNKEAPVLIETGAGASSLAMFLYCALYGGRVYSWDTNASKGAFLRSVASDAIGRVLGVDVHKIWKYIAFNSTDKNVGISVLGELGESADFGFFDSWHTLDHLIKEIGEYESIASERFMVALDDAYYRKRKENFSYINMLREKLGLPPIQEPKNNVCRPFHIEIEEYLNKNYENVEKLDDSYKHEYQDDIFFAYYDGDRRFMDRVGMEEKEFLDHRYDSWIVEKV